MKRGESGLSLVVAVNKPEGMTSHDVVNQCRRLFDERRVGHTGTLDPLASGVLPICVGPATRLARYLSSDDKSYRTTIELGSETDTDDREGVVVKRAEVPGELLTDSFAIEYVSGLVGMRQQVPPRYSAIKMGGKKAYELARAGNDVDLEPRSIMVYESALIDRFNTPDGIRWVVDFSVSKGTYIRALVRDMGRELGCYAHVEALERRRSGSIDLQECVSLESLESLGEKASLDPVRLLGCRIVFADGFSREVGNGGFLNPDCLSINELKPGTPDHTFCACMGSTVESTDPLEDGETIAVVVANRLKAIYSYDAKAGLLKPECVFSTGVSRG